MQPLQITAHLASAVPVVDDWTPSLESLLTLLLLDRHGLASPNPTPEQVEQIRPFVEANLPLQLGDLGGEWYWQCSAPHYFYTAEINDSFHKRWDMQEQHLDWQGKRRKWSTGEGHTKSWTVPMRLRNPERIDWFCVGDRAGIQDLLDNCLALGKKRKGQATRWTIQQSEDYHLWGHDGRLMKPIPIRLLSQIPAAFKILNWGWRPPTFSPQNMERCAMPPNNAVKING